LLADVRKLECLAGLDNILQRDFHIVGLVRQGSLEVRGWLGVKTRKPTEEEASALGMGRANSVMIAKLVDGGPAAAAGLVVGDGIATFNGRPIRGAFSLVWSVNSLLPNSEVTLGIVRKSGRSDLRLKLGRLPDAPPSKEISSAPAAASDKDVSCLRYVPSVGLTVAVACDE
jgi:serine protease Do